MTACKKCGADARDKDLHLEDDGRVWRCVSNAECALRAELREVRAQLAESMTAWRPLANQRNAVTRQLDDLRAAVLGITERMRERAERLDLGGRDARYVLLDLAAELRKMCMVPAGDDDV